MPVEGSRSDPGVRRVRGSLATSRRGALASVADRRRAAGGHLVLPGMCWAGVRRPL